MMERKNKNTLLPYSGLVNKILVYSGYNLEEKESDIKHSKIGKTTLSQMRFKIENREIISLPPKAPSRAQQQPENTGLSPSSISNNFLKYLLWNQQEMIRIQRRTNSRTRCLADKLAKTQLISPFVSSEDDKEMN